MPMPLPGLSSFVSYSMSMSPLCPPLLSGSTMAQQISSCKPAGSRNVIPNIRAPYDEVRDIRWMTVPELQQIVEETPERIFTLQLGVLAYYLQHASSHPRALLVRRRRKTT